MIFDDNKGIILLIFFIKTYVVVDHLANLYSVILR